MTLLHMWDFSPNPLTPRLVVLGSYRLSVNERNSAQVLLRQSSYVETQKIPETPLAGTRVERFTPSRQPTAVPQNNSSPVMRGSLSRDRSSSSDSGYSSGSGGRSSFGGGSSGGGFGGGRSTSGAGLRGLR